MSFSSVEPSVYHQILTVNVLKENTLEVQFEDGTSKLIDLSPFFGAGWSAALLDPGFFSQVKVEDGYLVWPNGYDLDANYLYSC